MDVVAKRVLAYQWIIGFILLISFAFGVFHLHGLDPFHPKATVNECIMGSPSCIDQRFWMLFFGFILIGARKFRDSRNDVRVTNFRNYDARSAVVVLSYVDPIRRALRLGILQPKCYSH